MKLNFIMAGRDLREPLLMDEALCLAVYDRPSADAVVIWNDEGETTIKSSWGSVEEASQKLAAYTQATLVIHRLLGEGYLKAYVLNPSNGVYMLVPRFYWSSFPVLEHLTHGQYVLQSIEDATGWDAGMAGQPILVDREDLPAWKERAAAAVARLAPAAKPADKPLREYRLKRTTPEQSQLATFLGLAAKHLPGGEQPETMERLYGRYKTYCANHKPAGRSKPLPISSESWFKKWTKRYNEGWRP